MDGHFKINQIPTLFIILKENHKVKSYDCRNRYEKHLIKITSHSGYKHEKQHMQ